MKPSPEVIVQTLINYRKAKLNLSEQRTELVKLACELGVDHVSADKMSVETFLDGYLVANNQMQPHRKQNGESK